MLDIQKRLTNSFYALLSLPATAMGFALSVQIAALSWILNTKYGFNLEEVGWVWLAGPMAGILGQVVVGLISDNVWFWGGRRRPFILIGGVISALMLLALPVLDKIHAALGFGSLFTIALLVALTLDLSINISFNPTRSLISDLTPFGKERTKGYAWMQTVSGFFGVVAYLIGAFVSNYALIDVGVIFVFLASVIPVFFIEEPRQLEAQIADETNAEIAQDSKFNRSEFLKICLAHAFTWLGVQTMFIYTFGFIKSNVMGYEVEAVLPESVNNNIGFYIGVAFAILNTVGFILPKFVFEPLSRTYGRVKIHTISIAIMCLGYLLVAFYGTSIQAFFVLMAVIGIGWAAVVSLPFAIMSEVVDQRKMGLYMGLFNLSVVLPQIVASLLGGYFDTQLDKSVIFVASAICLGVSAVLWLLVKEQKSSTTT